MPSFTFVSTANAFALRGATPGVRRHPAGHAQPRRDARSSSAITAAPARSCVVHYAGVACEMDAILADRRRATACRSSRTTRTASSARTADARSGTLGALAALSFHETKNFTCGEGGALLINDPDARRARRDHAREGHQPQRVLPRRGRQVHVGRHRLELPAVRPARRRPARGARRVRRHPAPPPPHVVAYDDALRTWAGTVGAQPPPSRRCAHPAHMYYLLMPSRSSRER